MKNNSILFFENKNLNFFYFFENYNKYIYFALGKIEPKGIFDNQYYIKLYHKT